MNKEFRKFAWLCVVVAGVFLVSNAYAWPEGRHCFRGEAKEGMKENMEGHFKEISKELNLTPEQEEELKNHKALRREEMKELRKRIDEAKEELGKELEKQEFDMDRINQLNSELKAAQSEKQDYSLNSILDVRKILTPEQYKRFREFTKKHCQGMKGKHKGMKGYYKGRGPAEETEEEPGE